MTVYFAIHFYIFIIVTGIRFYITYLRYEKVNDQFNEDYGIHDISQLKLLPEDSPDNQINTLSKISNTLLKVVLAVLITLIIHVIILGIVF